MKFEKNFVKPRVSEDIPHHDSKEMDKIGKNIVLLDDKSYSGAGIRMTTRVVKGVTEDPGDYVDLHSHEVDQIFIFLGTPENEESLEVEFVFEDEIYQIKSPITVFVPKGVRHTQKIVRGSGRYITLLKEGTYV
jgi:mannose-6-phosphate isomerase-like protein (cupin superfamily)